LQDRVRPALSEKAPLGGYLVPAAQAAWLQEKLALHGIESRVLTQGLPDVEVRAFRASKVAYGTASFEGHVPVTCKASGAQKGVRCRPARCSFPSRRRRHR